VRVTRLDVRPSAYAAATGHAMMFIDANNAAEMAEAFQRIATEALRLSR